MRVDEFAIALRARDALRARVLYAELLECDPATIEPPSLTDEIELAIAASITELIAARLGRAAPAWTQSIGPLRTPFELVTIRRPERLERLRRETPPQLRARGLVAPENFLLSA
jgi:hypothetical protein